MPWNINKEGNKMLNGLDAYISVLNYFKRWLSCGLKHPAHILEGTLGESTSQRKHIPLLMVPFSG